MWVNKRTGTQLARIGASSIQLAPNMQPATHKVVMVCPSRSICFDAAGRNVSCGLKFSTLNRLFRTLARRLTSWLISGCTDRLVGRQEAPLRHNFSIEMDGRCMRAKWATIARCWTVKKWPKHFSFFDGASEKITHSVATFHLAVTRFLWASVVVGELLTCPE